MAIQRARPRSMLSTRPSMVAVVGVDLADQIHLIESVTNRMANDFFSAAFGIHLGVIEQGHAQSQTFTKHLDLNLPPVMLLWLPVKSQFMEPKPAPCANLLVLRYQAASRSETAELH